MTKTHPVRSENLPHPLETICQMIVMQTKKFSRPSRNKLKTPDKQKRVMKSNEVPLIRLTTLKFYSKIRSKDLISGHFNKGMALSYSRVMDFTRDVSAVMIELFSRSEEHALSSAVRTGLFTVFAVDKSIFMEPVGQSSNIRQQLILVVSG